MRVEQPEGTRGSLRWIQRLVARSPRLLADAAATTGLLHPGEGVTWVSPRADDGWAEYRDADFLDRIGHPGLREPLAAFWPERGPQWDALGRADGGAVLLVEATAHVRELAATCQAGPESHARTERALARAKAELGADPSADWLRGYYQYANRLAHLQFLRAHNVPAALLFVYFTGDANMDGPASREAWAPVLADVYRHLGFPGDALPMPGVVNVYVDVGVLA